MCASNNAKKDAHPAPYPEDLIERLLKIYSYKNELVLDPFNGIGTTSLVACKLGRQFIGIELSKSYCDIALQRLRALKSGANLHIKTFHKDAAKLVNSDKITESLNEIFPYKEAFSPFLIEFLSTKFKCKIDSVFDPFCGVGSSFLNKQTTRCFGFDTNPFAINVSLAKLRPLNLGQINEALQRLKSFSPQDIKPFALPKWQSFGKYASGEKFSVIMSFIEYFMDFGELYHFVKYALLSNLDKMLDYKKDGNGIKYRKSKINDLNAYIKGLLNRAFELKIAFDKQGKKEIILKNTSSVADSLDIRVDCVLTSPPYANLFDYFEVYKMELWSSGLVEDYAQWKCLKKSALRNNKNSNLNANECIKNEILQKTLQNLQSKGLEQSTITMLKNYFYDMKIVLQKCFELLKNGGFCFIVVANSCYKGVPVKSDEILASEAEKIGFALKEIIIARKINTSSQQMKTLDNLSKFSLRESIIVLQKEVK